MNTRGGRGTKGPQSLASLSHLGRIANTRIADLVFFPFTFCRQLDKSLERKKLFWNIHDAVRVFWLIFENYLIMTEAVLRSRPNLDRLRMQNLFKLKFK